MASYERQESIIEGVSYFVVAELLAVMVTGGATLFGYMVEGEPPPAWFYYVIFGMCTVAGAYKGYNEYQIAKSGEWYRREQRRPRI